MIEVIIKYSRKTYHSGREIFFYKDIVVKGHSSDGTLNSIKCCAGVTAVTCGLINLLRDTFTEVEINKGYFHYRCTEKYSAEVNYAVNAMVYQLDSISVTYPQFFKFTFIEEKYDGEQINDEKIN